MSESTPWTYQWQITDPSMVQQMKNAKNTKRWCSPIFSASGFRWKLDVCPNGNLVDNKGCVNFFLRLVFLPPKVKSIVVAFTYGLLELERTANTTQTYDKKNVSYGWHSDQAR
eukprot:126276_1